MVLTSFLKSSFSLLFSLEKNIISFLVNTFNLVVENHTHHYIMKITNQNL